MVRRDFLGLKYAQFNHEMDEFKLTVAKQEKPRLLHIWDSLI